MKGGKRCVECCVHWSLEGMFWFGKHHKAANLQCSVIRLFWLSDVDSFCLFCCILDYKAVIKLAGIIYYVDIL